MDETVLSTLSRVVNKVTAAADSRRLVRPSREIRCLLGDTPVLVLNNDDDRVRSWLGGNVVPPVIRLQEGRELEILTSTRSAGSCGRASR
jgi:hypothetical protein